MEKNGLVFWLLLCWVKIWIILLMVFELYRLECGLWIISMCLISFIGKFWNVVRLVLVELILMLLISISIWLDLVLCRNSVVFLLKLLLFVSDMLGIWCNSFGMLCVWLCLIFLWLMMFIVVRFWEVVWVVWVVVIIWLVRLIGLVRFREDVLYSVMVVGVRKILFMFYVVLLFLFVWFGLR